MDKESEYFFISSYTSLKIIRCNLDGTGKKDILNTTGQVAGMEIDRVTKRIYWVSTQDKIEYADYNGQNRVVWIDLSDANRDIRGFTIDITSGKAIWGPYDDQGSDNYIKMATLPIYYPEYDPTAFKRYDNFYVQHPIPQSELGYSWIKNNVTSSTTYGYQKDANDISLQVRSRVMTNQGDYDPTTGMTTHQFSSSYGLSLIHI